MTFLRINILPARAVFVDLLLEECRRFARENADEKIGLRVVRIKFERERCELGGGILVCETERGSGDRKSVV